MVWQVDAWEFASALSFANMGVSTKNVIEEAVTKAGTELLPELLQEIERRSSGIAGL